MRKTIILILIILLGTGVFALGAVPPSVFVSINPIHAFVT